MSDDRNRTDTLFLVNILNTMYNDNLRQINNLTNTLNNIIRSNNRIQDMLVQLLTNRNTGTINNDFRTQNNPFPTNNNNNNRRRNNHPSSEIDNLSMRLLQSILNPTQMPQSSQGLTAIYQEFLNPITIHPTPQQIETATRRARYCDIARPLNTSCPISMEEFNDNDNVTVIRNCGHIFHTEHLMNWFRTNCRCPVCRHDIRDYSNETAYDVSGNHLSSNIGLSFF